MLYNTPALKRAAALAAMKKTSTSKCSVHVESILTPRMLLTPAEHSGFITSQLFLDGVEQTHPRPCRSFSGITLAGDGPGSFDTTIAVAVQGKPGRAGAGKPVERGGKEPERASKLSQ